MRQPAADEPELLVEAYGVDDERVAFPVTDRIAEIAGDQIVFGRMLAPRFHRDPAPVPVFPIDDEDALQLGLIDELHAVRHGEKPHPSRRLAARMRIVEPAPRAAVVVQRPRPLLERDLVEGQVAGQSARPDWTAAGDVPESLDARHLAQIDASVRPTRGRLRGRRRLPAGPRATPSARTTASRAPRAAARIAAASLRIQRWER